MSAMQFPSATPVAKTYHLAVKSGPAKWRFLLEDRGVSLDSDRISWPEGDGTRSGRLTELREIHLSTYEIRGKFIPSCVLTFSSGAVVTIVGSSSHGLPDLNRRRTYAAFVSDLHARLDPATRSRVRFGCGFSSDRANALRALVIGGMATTALLLIMFALAGSHGGHVGLRMFFVVVGVGVGTWRLNNLVNANTPRDYHPDLIPTQMIPD